MKELSGLFTKKGKLAVRIVNNILANLSYSFFHSISIKIVSTHTWMISVTVGLCFAKTLNRAYNSWQGTI